MKTATLHQIAHLNSGVIGELKIGGLTLQTLETRQCLEEGDHYLKPHENGRFCIGEDYFILMDRNGPYRNKGLCLGMKWDHRSFDVMQKGDAMQSLLSLVGDKMKIVVTRTNTDFKAKVELLEARLEKMEGNHKNDLDMAAENLSHTRDAHDAELSEVKAALKWAVAQTSPGKAATKAQALETIAKIEGEDNEPDGNDISPSV